MPDSTRPNPVVVGTSNGPYACLKPVPLTAVTLTDEFWAPRLRINWEVTFPSQNRLLEVTGRIDNFRGVAAMDPAQFWRKGQSRFVHSGPHYGR